MIKYIAVDPLIWEKAVKDHLALIRQEFDTAKSYSRQYDIACKARLYYGERVEVLALENDLKNSTKPKH